MTEAEITRIQDRAERDAKELSLLLLIALKRKTGTGFVQWDASTGRFIYRGQFVTAATVRKFLLRIQDRMAARIAALTTRLEKGEITIDDWQAQFEDTIASSHVLAAAFAVGGIATAVRAPFVQSQITEQWGFARAFVRDVERKRQPLTFARIKSRAKSYIQAAHITFANVELELVKLTGVKTMARNVLRPAEHCEGRVGNVIGCIDVTSLGWIPVEEITPVGQRLCSIYCRCFLEYQ